MNTLRDPYEARFRQKLDSFCKELWDRPELLASIERDQAEQVLDYLLELACQAQNMRNITLARTALLAVPHDWLLIHIDQVARSRLDLQNEWEYRRLGDVYLRLVPELVEDLVAHGRRSDQPDIQEAAEDLATMVAKGEAPYL